MGEYNRQPRAKRIREIQSCALIVFLKKGYRNTTMEDIVSASSLSKGGLYHYYGSTKDILFDIMRRSNYDFIDANIDIEAGTTVETLCASLTESAVKRIIEPTQVRRLYLMFIDEMLYDPDFEEVYLQLEKEIFLRIEKTVRKVLPDFRIEFANRQLLFFSRLLNAMLISQNLFSDKSVFIDASDQLYHILYQQFMDILKQSD